MNRTPDQNNRRFLARRPDDVELLAFLHGELPAGRRSDIERILAASAEARHRLKTLEEDQAICDRFLSPELPPAFPTTEHTLRKLRDRLNEERLGERAETAALLAVPVRSTSIFTRRWMPLAASLIVATSVLAWFLARQSVGTVSAASIIRKTADAEQARIGRVNSPVIHQRLNVRRLSEGQMPVESTWEVWNQIGNDRLVEKTGNRVTGPSNSEEAQIVSELREVYARNQIDAKRPLSVAALAVWRASADIADSVNPARTERGEMAYSISATAIRADAVDQIIKAETVVRASDWHPVRQTLEVQAPQGIRQYELTEESYEVVSLASVSTLFEPPPSLPSPSSAGTQLLAPVVLPALPDSAAIGTSSTNSLGSAWVEVQYALHKLKACTDGQVTVQLNSDGRLLVAGFARSEQRRREIVDALAGLRSARFVQNDIQALNQSAASPAERPASDRIQPAARSQNGWSPVAVASVDHALIEATALYFLAEGPGQDITIPAESRWLLENMVRDHLSAIANALSEVRPREGVSGTSTTRLVGGAPGKLAEWPLGAIGLFRDVRSLDTLLPNLFESANSPESALSATPSEQLLEKLLSEIADPAAVAAEWLAKRGN